MMKKKRPVFTYIITFLNSFFTMFVVSVFGSCFVMATDVEAAEHFTFIDLYYPSIEFGFLFCIGFSLLYFVLVRTRKFRPRWWSNSLFILISYLVVPLHAFLTSLIMELTFEHNGEALGEAMGEAFMLSILGFIIAALCSKSKRKPPIENRKPKFQSPLWIAPFALLHYVCFFMTAVFASLLIQLKFALSAGLILNINRMLRLPFFGSLTHDFVAQYMPGKLAHIVLLANAVVWGVAIWQALKHFKNRHRAESRDRIME